MDAQDFRSLQEAYLDVYENEQLDELSVNKMHDYINKAEKDRDRLNKKWDQGTATSKERKKVFDREEGEARASKKIRQKTGKDSFRLNALDKLKSAITKESYDIFDAILEHLLDEAIYSEKGKAKAAEMIAKRSTPSGRAKSGKGANVAQIRQIRGSGRGRFDREGLGGTPMTPTMAKNPIKKQNYDGTGNKAARRAGTYKESFNIFVNSMIAEGVSMERYTWEEIQNVFDDLFEAQVANRNPDEYERKAKQGQSREQQLKGKVMGRMSQMDPDKKAAMLKQMRAVGLDV